MPFPFEEIRHDHSWYPMNGYEYKRITIKIEDDANILTCESMMDLLSDGKFREEEHKKFNDILVAGNERKFEMILRRFIFTDIHLIHGPDNDDCSCHKNRFITRREQSDIINMFYLMRFDKKFMNIYLNMINSFTIVSDDYLYKTYFENVVSREFNEWMNSPDCDKNVAVCAMDKLRDQYGVRFYLIDFTEHTRDDGEYFAFPYKVDKAALIHKVTWFLENRYRLRDEWDPLRKFNGTAFDYNMIYVYTWQIARYKFDDPDGTRYTLDGKNMGNSLFIRRLQCLVFLIMNLNMVGHPEPETDEMNFDEQCARAYYLISWLTTLKEYYSAVEWNKLVNIVKNTPKHEVTDSDGFFEVCPWAIKYDESEYNNLLLYVIDKI